MKKAKVVVDATCGNGHDLLYLAKRAQKDVIYWHRYPNESHQ